MLDIIILAAGKGTRMKSNLPKVLHCIAGKPMLTHVVEAAKKLGNHSIHVIVGHGAKQIENELAEESSLSFIEQTKQLGTGHAVQQVLPKLSEKSISLILYGDVPLISSDTLNKLIKMVNKNTLGLLTVCLENPSGYGRIVRNSNNKVAVIIEQKDASSQQLLINEVNTGIMAVNSADLKKWLPKLSNNNAQGEYYLTDIIEMAVSDGIEVVTTSASNEWEVQGVNNRQQQAELERVYQNNQARLQMENGVTLLDPNRFDCRGKLSCGEDVIIDVNCLFEGDNTIANGVIIGPNCIIKNSSIGKNTEVKANTLIEDSIVSSDCVIGPFARLRPGTKLSSKVKIGNFVETKKALIGEESKVNHLSYVGDATIGEGVNIGAGTITCNYDGVNKFQTTIEDGVFVGSNSALVAPVTLGKGSTIGAGSVINKNVEPEVLALSRASQKKISSWQRPEKKRPEKNPEKK